MAPRSWVLDPAAVTLSSLCLLHCLLLPALAVTLPMAGVVSEQEWLHRLLLLLALPISTLAFLRKDAKPLWPGFRVMAFLGGVLLLLGGFVEALHDHELVLTALGSVLLALAHLGAMAARSHHRRRAARP